MNTIQLLEIPQGLQGEHTFPDGTRVFVANSEQEAQAKIEEWTTQEQPMPDGNAPRPYTPQEILFLKMLAKFLVICKLMVTGLP